MISGSGDLSEQASTTKGVPRPVGNSRAVEAQQPALVERTHCPCCEARDARPLLDVEYRERELRDYLKRHYPRSAGELDLLADHSYRLVECSSCTLIYQVEVPGPEFLYRLYERWVEAPDGLTVSKRNRKVEYFSRHSDEILDVLTAIGGGPYDIRVMDYGFGWGHWARLVKGFGCSVSGYELSRERQKCAEEIGIEVLDWDEIPHQEVDWIYSNQVFEHLVEPLETLRHLVRALKPGGFVSLGVPSGFQVNKAVARLPAQPRTSAYDSLGAVMPLEHINCFTQRAMFRMVREVGLTPRRIRQRPRLEGLRQVSKHFLRPIYQSFRGLRPGHYVFVKNP